MKGDPANPGLDLARDVDGKLDCKADKPAR